MKKKVLFVFVLLMLVGFLAACTGPTCKHVDKDDDLLCDLCGEEFDDGEEPAKDEFEIKITSVSEPAFVSTWKINKGEQTNKKTEFMVLNNEYVVGDDNAFIFKPTVTFIKVNKETGATLPAAIKEWNYEIQVFVKENGEFVDVNTVNTKYVDKIDTKECKVDFSEFAIGKEFKIVVFPDGLSEDQLSSGNYKTEFEFKVIEGYNAYNALDLAYIENRSIPVDENGKELEDVVRDAWVEFKKENGLDLNYAPAAIILHEDIKITTADLPGQLFWTAEEVSPLDADYSRVVGSMKDYRDFYLREMKENEEFKLIGNYFKVDNSELPVVVRENDKITPEGSVISHATLFRFEGAGTGNVVFEDLRIIGNAGRTENATLSGGQILIKVIGPQMLAYNNISVNTFIHYFAEHNDDKVSNDNTTVFTIEKCKGYNAFNSFLYNWGSHMIVKDSELIGAGGPAVLQDWCSTDIEGGKDHAPTTEIYNSKVESFVAGSEGWFKIVQADSIVPGIKQLSQIFNMVGKTFVIPNDEEDPAKQVTFMNLICVTKSGSAQSFTQVKIDGKMVKDQYTFDYGVTAAQNGNPYIKAVLDQTFELNAPAFETSAGGFAYFDGNGLAGLDQQYIQDPTNPIFAGDTISLYYMGMMLTLGYYNVGDVHSTK